MYKLILVDDEEEVRKGIVDKIEWDKYGFEIAGEAENGIEALEIAEKVAPDVVITDIKMPFIDGLTLAKMIRERYATTRIIILTGFDEFEYAQKAIKMDVVEYILKPISAKEITEVLVKVKNEIDAEIAQKRDLERLRTHYYNSLPVLKEKFLGSLITGRLSRQSILEKLSMYGIELSGRGFVVSVLSIGFRDSDDSNYDNNEEGSFNIKIEDRELIKFSILGISEEIVNKYNAGIVFMHEDFIVFILSFGSEISGITTSKLLAVLEEIRQSIKKYYDVAVTIGMGTPCTDIDGISFSYKNAEAALDYRLVLGSDKTICIEDVEPRSAKKVAFDELKEKALISSIKVGTNDEVEKTIYALFDEIIDEKTSFKDCQIYLLEALTSILKTARDLNVDMDNVFGDNYNMFVEIYKFKDLKDIREWMLYICTRIRAYVSRDRQDSGKYVVKKAIEYIMENYSKSDMTIDQVCSYLHISPTYFSTLFKRDTKLTFVNYLTRVRMDAAKELLRTTDLKTFEIANRVGYSESNYFSYCFKKNFGISPSEYRKAAR